MPCVDLSKEGRSGRRAKKGNCCHFEPKKTKKIKLKHAKCSVSMLWYQICKQTLGSDFHLPQIQCVKSSQRKLAHIWLAVAEECHKSGALKRSWQKVEVRPSCALVLVDGHIFEVLRPCGGLPLVLP